MSAQVKNLLAPEQGFDPVTHADLSDARKTANSREFRLKLYSGAITPERN
jgi:hypothetical protein